MVFTALDSTNHSRKLPFVSNLSRLEVTSVKWKHRLHDQPSRTITLFLLVRRDTENERQCYLDLVDFGSFIPFRTWIWKYVRTIPKCHSSDFLRTRPHRHETYSIYVDTFVLACWKNHQLSMHCPTIYEPMYSWPVLYSFPNIFHTSPNSFTVMPN